MRTVVTHAPRRAMMRDPKTGRFMPGNGLYPAGRPKGAREKVNVCLDEVYADWLANGTKTIRRMRTERPHDYVRVLIAALPRDIRRQAWLRYHGR
jgi:hypothetical protein